MTKAFWLVVWLPRLAWWLLDSVLSVLAAGLDLIPFPIFLAALALAIPTGYLAQLHFEVLDPGQPAPTVGVAADR